MANNFLITFLLCTIGSISFAQNSNLARLDFLLGDWQGVGSGYVNQYVLNDSLSGKTELIENFVPGGQARWAGHWIFIC